MRIIPRGWRKNLFWWSSSSFGQRESQRLFFPEGWRINKFDHPNERSVVGSETIRHTTIEENAISFDGRHKEVGHTQKLELFRRKKEIYLDICITVRCCERERAMECSMDRDQQSTSDNRHISSLFSVEELSIVPHYCGIGNNIREIFLKSLTYLTPYPTYMLMKPPKKIFDIIFWYDRLIVPFLIYVIHRKILVLEISSFGISNRYFRMR